MLGAAVVVGLALVAGAQDPTQINQTNRDAPGLPQATGAAQVGGRAAPLPTTATPARDRNVAGSAAPASGPLPYLQLAPEEARIDAGAQVAGEDAGGVGPAPSADLRAKGRNTAVVRPNGPDRCDPQTARSRFAGGAPGACDRVIEARASEFLPPDHQPLSAEQSLMATQRQLRPVAMDTSTAARRLANGEVDNSTAALAIASVTLRPVERGPEEEMPTEGTSTIDAIVSGITTLVTGTPPNP